LLYISDIAKKNFFQLQSSSYMTKEVSFQIVWAFAYFVKHKL